MIDLTQYENLKKISSPFCFPKIREGMFLLDKKEFVLYYVFGLFRGGVRLKQISHFLECKPTWTELTSKTEQSNWCIPCSLLVQHLLNQYLDNEQKSIEYEYAAKKRILNGSYVVLNQLARDAFAAVKETKKKGPRK